MVWTKGYVSVYPEMGALIMKKGGKFLTWIVLAGLLALPLGMGEASVEKQKLFLKLLTKKLRNLLCSELKSFIPAQ